MSWTDMILMGIGNLFRSRLRSFLTLLGVVVGIGALSSMMSFGTGVRKNITDAFVLNDLFTSITVLPPEMDPTAIASGNLPDPEKLLSSSSPALNDSVVEAISRLPGVIVAVPDQYFPARLSFGDREARVQVQVIPSVMSAYPPFNNLLAGRFFHADTATGLILTERAIDALKIRLEENDAEADTSGKYLVVPAASLVNARMEMVTMGVNVTSIGKSLFGTMLQPPGEMLKENSTPAHVAGILKRQNLMGFSRFRGDVIVSPGFADKIPRLGFNSVWDLLKPGSNGQTYTSVYVRTKDVESVAAIRQNIEEMGLNVFSLADELDEFKQQFLIMQSLLGAIGFIALFVAALGIINTMVMSIMERIREIGIMKSIGASDRGILMIFFTEAGTIGIFGGIFGLLLGWAVTRVANLILNSQLIEETVEKVDLFYFPWWLLAGSLAFSVLVSLAAGIYPALRAARTDPVKALRHD